MMPRVMICAAASLIVSVFISPAGATLQTQNVQAPLTTSEIGMMNRSENAAKEAEEWELKGASAFGEGQEQAPGLRHASVDLADYLKTHPRDVRALLLQARVSRALIVVTPVAIKLEDSGGHITAGDTSKERSTALAALDAVIALQPKNAEAFYWKARTLNLSSPGAEQVGAEASPDFMPALAAARMAANLDPANAMYREYLAMVLFGLGQDKEASEELQKLPFRHPVLQLAEDEKAVPVPPNSESDVDKAYDIASALFSGQMDKFRYAGKRPRVFNVPLLPVDIQAFYRRLWPTIHWVKDRENGSISAGFLWREDKLDPTADSAPFLSDFNKRTPPSGVLLLIARDEEAKVARSTLYIVNFRRFEKREP